MYVNEYLRNELTVRRLLVTATALLTVQTFLTWRQVRVVKRLTPSAER